MCAVRLRPGRQPGCRVDRLATMLALLDHRFEQREQREQRRSGFGQLEFETDVMGQAG